jgi:uncharacterized protein
MPGKIHAVVLKLAALCNLNCSYCYVYNHVDKSFRHRPRFMSDEVFERALTVMAEYCERRDQHGMAITFHGGEPMLVGAARFDSLARRARTVLGDRLRGLAIQTNATLVDDEWADVFERQEVQIGVSMDGPAAVHDQLRVDHLGRGSHADTVAGLARMQAHGLDPGILCVINPDSSGIENYRHFRALGAQRMNFLLPDASHDSKARLYGRFGGTPVADYLIPIFDSWFDEDDPDIDIRVFNDLLLLMMGGESETDAFGNPLMTYLIVETGGAIEALDALRVCDEGITNSGLNILENSLEDLHLGLPLLHRAVHEGFPLATICQTCLERDVCGGGYLPHRYARANGFDNPSVWCVDILKLLAHIRARLEEAARA